MQNAHVYLPKAAFTTNHGVIGGTFSSHGGVGSTDVELQAKLKHGAMDKAKIKLEWSTVALLGVLATRRQISQK